MEIPQALVLVAYEPVCLRLIPQSLCQPQPTSDQGPLARHLVKLRCHFYTLRNCRYRISEFL